jgi:hypothetical protein
MDQLYSSELSETNNIYEQLVTIANQEFGSHPFTRVINKAQLESILPEHFAISLAFRYLQAAAQKDVIFDAIHENRNVSEEMEMMNAVANFLTWDESGGNTVLLSYGKAGLPSILDTHRWFHSNILRADAIKILGHPISPHFSVATRQYLVTLYQGLASADAIQRCAYMVAFELHAAILIDSLWKATSAITNLPRQELRYFDLHVGGNDPAEKYHVEMTMHLIDRVVPSRKHALFLWEFRNAFQLNFNWCNALVQQPTASQAPTTENLVLHQGACHCGGVRFEVQAPAAIKAIRCNCSICDKSGFLHLLVPREDFHLLSGDDLLTTYQFNLRIAKHTFCRICGIKPFYRPRSNPNGFSVNVRCLNRSTITTIEIQDFDGEHWEESIHELV